MSRISLVHAGFSAVTFIYSMFFLQVHALMVFNPVLLIAPWYLPLEIVTLALLVGWSLYMFGYWFIIARDGGLDE